MLVLVLLVGSSVVIALDDVQNKWKEGVDEDMATVIVFTPLFEQIDQLLAKTALTVLCLKHLKEVGNDLWSHLGYSFFVELGEGLECLDWKVHHFSIRIVKLLHKVIKD